jgi:tetratricopeptide (TPR) repeat protein
MNLGVALRAQGRDQEALGHFQNAVLLRPFYPEALTNLAIVTAETGNFPEAEALFRRALSANPNNSDYRANLVQFLAQRNAPGAALEVGIESLSQLKANGRLRTLVESIAARDCGAFEVGWRPGPVLVNKIKVWPVPQLEALRQALRKIELCRGD